MKATATYLDSSAIVKLAVREPESQALRAYLRRRQAYISSALARAEVARALRPLGPAAMTSGEAVLARVELVRVSDAVLRSAGALPPEHLRTLDAIHLATALMLGTDLGRLVTYDLRMRVAARQLGIGVSAPG